MERTISLIEDKTNTIYGKETPPDVIIICIPDKVCQKYASASSFKQRIQTEESDLHNRIKLNSIVRKVPTQLIHPNTLKWKRTQDPSDVTWNLTVGLLYVPKRASLEVG